MTDELPLVTESRARRPALRYHGGKWTLAPWIISYFPEHKIYVEPFGGAASVLIRKPRSRIEVYNELDDDVVGLFRILRDPGKAQELADLISLTPFSRSEFRLAYEPTDDALERARRLVVRSYFGFGSHSFNADNSNGFRWMPAKPYAKEWCGVALALLEIVNRFRGVTIECADAREVIVRMDRADALFFVDPPYPDSTRDNNGKGYRFEMTDGEHRQLAYILRSVKGKVVLCGYPCSLYDLELYSDWHRVERKAYAGGQKGRSERTEVLWMNFAPNIKPENN